MPLPASSSKYSIATFSENIGVGRPYLIADIHQLVAVIFLLGKYAAEGGADAKGAFADFRGNKQYVSTGNLMTNDRVWAKNASRSALIWSACVLGIPCGKPG